MAIFHRRFTPKVVTHPAGASLDAWKRAAGELEFERSTVGEHVDKFERFLAEHARRQQGAPRHPGEARGRYPLMELIPPYELVMCDSCKSRAPLALMREVIQWQDTTLRKPARVWYACSMGCSQFLQRTLKAGPEQIEALGQAQRSHVTIPLIDRGRGGGSR